MNTNHPRLGGQLGVALCVLGFLGIFLGWNGAAGSNVSMAQFPYLISGGIAGLALVVIGAAMLVVQSAREDRARLEGLLERLATALEAGGTTSRGPLGSGTGAVGSSSVTGGGMLVLAGTTSYHRLDCSLMEARDDAHVLPLEEALAGSADACRVCRPPALARPTA